MVIVFTASRDGQGRGHTGVSGPRCRCSWCHGSRHIGSENTSLRYHYWCRDDERLRNLRPMSLFDTLTGDPELANGTFFVDEAFYMKQYIKIVCRISVCKAMATWFFVLHDS